MPKATRRACYARRMSTAIDHTPTQPIDAEADPHQHAQTCTCAAATKARSVWTLLLAFAMLALALSSALTKGRGTIMLVLAGAFLLELWHIASPPATADWWKRPRVWLGILGALLGLAAFVIGVTDGFGRLGESLNP